MADIFEELYLKNTIIKILYHFISLDKISHQMKFQLISMVLINVQLTIRLESRINKIIYGQS